MTDFQSIRADAFHAQWVDHDGANPQHVDVRWENDGFTAVGELTGDRVQYVLRLSPAWEVRQLMLFRDLDDPDLWLASDGQGRWGEMNGVYRGELDGCVDVHVVGSAFTRSLPWQRLANAADAEHRIIVVDPETLGVTVEVATYRRTASDVWHLTSGESGWLVTLDQHGVINDVDGVFRRVPRTSEATPASSR